MIGNTNMKKNTNLGRIDGDTYYKTLQSDDIVMLENGRMTLPYKVIQALIHSEVKTVVFLDSRRLEKWEIDAYSVYSTMQPDKKHTYVFPLHSAKRLSVVTGKEINHETTM